MYSKAIVCFNTKMYMISYTNYKFCMYKWMPLYTNQSHFLFLTEIFVGQLKSELKFNSCGHRSVTFDPFWDLSLPVPKVYTLRVGIFFFLWYDRGYDNMSLICHIYFYANKWSTGIYLWNNIHITHCILFTLISHIY
jgi:hypothetical protein